MPYKPGHWFNSAKFLDIEYQTYGWVFAKPKENEAHFHWKHEDDTKCITVCYNKTSNEFLGINTFGIRMQHEIFDRWLTEKRDVDYVMNHLPEANFDPEFYKHYEKDILTAYNKPTSNRIIMSNKINQSMSLAKPEANNLSIKQKIAVTLAL